MQRIGTQQEYLTLLTLNIRLTTRVITISIIGYQMGSRSSQKRTHGFCSRIYFEADVLKTCPNCCIWKSVTENVEVLTRCFAIPWAIKIPGRNDISSAIKFIIKKLFQATQTKFLFPQMDDYWTFAWITSACYTVQTIQVERVSNRKWKKKNAHEWWFFSALITPLYQLMQLSVAYLLPYSSVLFHSSSLLNSCCTPDLDRATAYCASALVIKLEANARWNSWASNSTSCFNAGRML